MAKRSALLMIAPGMLIAATGVGAGDLATASLAGAHVGLGVLWAVALGALMKFVVTEGLARWQLATGDTILEGSLQRFGRPFQLFFLLYLLGWSFFVGAALMAACGIVAAPLLPGGYLPGLSKVVLGAVHSALAVALVLVGGFRLFERLMGLCIALMFATVVVTALRVGADPAAVLSGLLVPRPAVLQGEALTWVIAVVGGVGGTLTVLCYGYWIREHGRTGTGALRETRIDLAIAYTMTGVFGVCMVVIGSGIDLAPDAKGAVFIVALADALREAVGPLGRTLFLVGAWGAMFSSLFGVWQSVPYVFADFWYTARKTAPPEKSLERTRPYRAYLFLIATVPVIALTANFVTLQKVYAIVGALFLPLLAFALLMLNGPMAPAHHGQRNKWYTALALVAVLVFFGALGARDVLGRIGW